MRERRLHGHHRIQQRDEVRPRADRIDRGAGAALRGIEPRRGGRGEVPARRRAEHPDPIGPDAELARSSADRAHRAQQIQQGRRMPVFRQAVLQDEDGHARAREMRRDAVHFVRHGESRIAATCAHNHGSAVGSALWRRVDSQRRHMNIADAAINKLFDAAAGGIDGRAGNTFRPQRDFGGRHLQQLRRRPHGRRDANRVNAALEPRHAVLANANRRLPRAHGQERDRA